MNIEESNSSSSPSSRTLISFLEPYRTRFIIVYALAVVIAALELLPPLFTKWLIDNGIGGHSLPVVFTSVAGIVVVSLVVGGLDFLQGWHNSIGAESSLQDLRQTIVGHLCFVPLAFFAKARRGEIMNRIAGDVELIRRSVSRGILSLAADAFDVIFLTIAMLVLDWRLAAITALVGLLFVFPVAVIVRRMSASSNALNERRDDLTSFVQRVYSVSGMSLLRSFGARKFEEENAVAIGERTYIARRQFGKQNQILLLVGGLLVVIVPALIWFVGGIEIFGGRGSIGTIVAFQTYAMRAFASISMLSALGSQVVNANSSFARIQQTLDLSTEDRNGCSAQESLAISQEVILDDVTFAYDDAQRVAINHLQINFSAPGYYTLVGPSGSGKTSLIYALHKHVLPSSGSIRVGDKATTSLAAPSIRAAIALVLQDTFLQNVSLIENIRYGRPDATFEEVLAAAKLVYLDEVVQELSDGWDHRCGDRGSNLSGGQRQRVSIARAILRDAPVIVLDESTNELDFMLERRIVQNIRLKYRERLFIHITHRLSTCTEARKIFVLANGEVIEHGQHDDLLRSGGLYAKLFSAWIRDVPTSIEVTSS